MRTQAITLLEEELNIVIIEDDPVIRRNVEKYLSLEETVQSTSSFGSVEAFLRSNPSDQENYNILLLDIGLPGMSGLEALSILKQRHPQLDIIMLTSFEDESTVVKALCSGAVAYISKKSSLEEIVRGIHSVKNGGSYMSPVIAREILNYMVRGEVKKRPSLLTDRQIQILEGLVDGKSYAGIADDLGLSVETVRSHIKRMYKTLHVNNKVEAIRKYLNGEL